MRGKNMVNVEVGAIISIILIFSPIVLSQSATVIPEDKSQVIAWFNDNVKPASDRTGSLDPVLAQAEAEPTVIKVVQGGGGDFDTITHAIESIPTGNAKRMIIWIGPGTYKEKIKIERTKPFVTLFGDAFSISKLTFNGTAKVYGTVDSASLIVESDFFMAVNLVIANSAPRPDGKKLGQQGVSMRISGDEAAFYNCKFIGFQDTLCDDRGNHFFMNCYIHGTVDFIFGSGKSLYLETELYIAGETGLTVITAQARESHEENTGYSFVHCRITGTAHGAYLGRAWKTSPRVVYAYSDMSNVVNPEGWSHNLKPERAKTVFYGEYKCTGEGSDPNARVPFSAQLTETVAQQFLNLGFIDGSKWLLPPPNL